MSNLAYFRNLENGGWSRNAHQQAIQGDLVFVTFSKLYISHISAALCLRGYQDGSKVKLEKAKITLNDCLACR